MLRDGGRCGSGVRPLQAGNKIKFMRFAPALLSLLLIPALNAQTESSRKAADILQTACTGCHGLNRITDTSKTRDEWDYTVNEMVSRGADVKPDEVAILVPYLTRFFGVEVNVNKATAKELEAELVLTSDEAAAIVQTRTDYGSFKDFSDLEKVKGLNTKKLEPIKDRLTYETW